MPKYCCFCISLRTGTIIIAVIGLLQATVNFAMALYLKNAPVKEREALTEPESPVVYALGASIGLLVYGLLLNGAINGRRKHLMPFLICSVLGIIIVAFGFLALVVMSAGAHRADIAVACFVGGGIIVALSTYIFLVVRSFYEQLREEEMLHTAQPNISTA